MDIVPWKPFRGVGPWKPFRDFEEEMSRMFENFFGRRHLPSLPEGMWAPLVDVKEAKNDIVVTAELPEIDPKNVSISVEGNVLTIKGERKQEEETKKEDYYLCERSYGSFMRSVTLPKEVDAEKTKAAYKEGVLTVTLPKLKEVKGKEIKVKVE